MAFIVADRVKETSTTTGTGNIALAGAVTGYQAFDDVMANNDTCYYVIELQSGSEWEVGLGTFNDTDTLVRTTPTASSNAGAAVNFSAGTKNVFMAYTANKTGTGKVVLDTSPGFTTAANPVSNDGAALGTTALQW